MSQKAVDIKQIRQVQQLRVDGVPIKEIVRRTGISRKTVKKYLLRMEGMLSSESEPPVVSDKELAAVVYNDDRTMIKGQRFEALIAHFE